MIPNDPTVSEVVCSMTDAQRKWLYSILQWSCLTGVPGRYSPASYNTVEIVDSMNEQQRNVSYFLIGMLIENKEKREWLVKELRPLFQGKPEQCKIKFSIPKKESKERKERIDILEEERKKHNLRVSGKEIADSYHNGWAQISLLTRRCFPTGKSLAALKGTQEEALAKEFAGKVSDLFCEYTTRLLKESNNELHEEVY